MSLLAILGLASLLFVVLFTANAYRDDSSEGGRQSRRQSIIEVWISLLIGFSINFVMNLLLLPLLGAQFTALENFWLGCIYTSVSIMRQYAVRRWFSGHIHAWAGRAAKGLS